jgi:TonB family protein
MRRVWLALLLAGCSRGGASSKSGDAPTELGTSGHLAREKIEAVVRKNHGVFRDCFEKGHTRNRRLKGQVTVRFVIDRDGRVSLSELEKSTLGDEQATSCIVDGFRKLRFPHPDGGVVTVVYPMKFSPG